MDVGEVRDALSEMLPSSGTELFVLITEDILEEEEHLQIVGNAKKAIGINTICSSGVTRPGVTRSQKGIGSKMLKELELYAVKQGINVIFVSAPTDDAKLWYTKKGFVQNDELYEYYDFWHKIIEP